MKFALAVSAFFAPFFFPWPFAAALAFLFAVYEPIAGLAIGVLFDCLYFSSGAMHFPWATFLGAVGSVVALVVRRFIKTRIIGA